MSDLSAVLCDIGGVLNHTEWEALNEHLAAVSDADTERIKTIENELRLHHLDTGDISVEEFVHKFQHRVNLRLSVDEYKAVLHEYVHWHHEVIDELRRLQATLYTLSNNSALYITRARRSWLANIFDTQFYSHEIGVRKPNREIYEHALNNIDELPQNCVFIDDQQDNLLPAETLGVRTYHYTGLKGLTSFLRSTQG